MDVTSRDITIYPLGVNFPISIFLHVRIYLPSLEDYKGIALKVAAELWKVNVYPGKGDAKTGNVAAETEKDDA